ncbi:peptidoglycan binding domain protein [Peptoniphilus sp. oral taxon 375 str. F0436]|nr:peptidoglycan binding domain protein [Peptoniphilus sp. oral taxon 375 str. F0436]
MKWIKDQLLGSLWGKILLALLALLVLALGYGLVVHQSDKIYPGVRVGKLGLGSMTKLEAKQKLEEDLDANLDKTLDLEYQDKHYRTSLRDLGYSYEIDAMVDQAYRIGRSGNKGADFLDAFYSLFRQPLPIQGAFKGDKLDDYLHGLADDLFILAKDAQLSIEDGQVHLVQDQDGRYLDTNLTRKALENWDGSQAIVLPVFDRPADVQAKMLEKMDSVLGEFTSNYASSEKNRKYNIALGAEN